MTSVKRAAGTACLHWARRSASLFNLSETAMPGSNKGQLTTRCSQTDIEHGMELEVLGPDPIVPGTEIVAVLANEARGSLRIVAEKDAGIWQAQWHDEAGTSAHDGALVRLILVPPIEYEDEKPSVRRVLVELIGDHELEGPEASP